MLEKEHTQRLLFLLRMRQVLEVHQLLLALRNISIQNPKMIKNGKLPGREKVVQRCLTSSFTWTWIFSPSIWFWARWVVNTVQNTLKLRARTQPGRVNGCPAPGWLQGAKGHPTLLSPRSPRTRQGESVKTRITQISLDKCWIGFTWGYVSVIFAWTMCFLFPGSINLDEKV